MLSYKLLSVCMECLPGWDLLDNVCLLACVCLAVAARFCVLIIVTSAECREEYEAATQASLSLSLRSVCKFLSLGKKRRKNAPGVKDSPGTARSLLQVSVLFINLKCSCCNYNVNNKRRRQRLGPERCV
jgi:hypothetical protein